MNCNKKYLEFFHKREYIYFSNFLDQVLKIFIAREQPDLKEKQLRVIKKKH